MAGRDDPDRKPRHPVESVNNALRLLLMFRDGGQIRISKASRDLGVVPSTAHRLMAMLEYHGFVTQNPETRAYEVGPTLTELGLSTVRNLDSRDNVRASLTRLANRVGETVHFQVLEGTDVLFVDGIESTKAVRTTLRVGDRRPAHCTSGGKAMLADFTSAELRSLYSGRRLSACTKQSITKLKSFEADLERVRSRGYALSIAESESDIAAIGVVVRDPSGRAFGSFSVSMPISRYDEADLPRIVEALNAVAADAQGGVSTQRSNDQV